MRHRVVLQGSRCFPSYKEAGAFQATQRLRMTHGLTLEVSVVERFGLSRVSRALKRNPARRLWYPMASCQFRRTGKSLSRVQRIPFLGMGLLLVVRAP
jgi:hypothetical protein